MRLLKTLLKSLIVIPFLLSCASKDTFDYSSLVDPMIGTGGHGHTFPGAVYPHGMIQPSPDTRIYGWDACGGYYYNDSTINGFSHTHLSGTGCCDYGDVLIMPTVGEQEIKINTEKSNTLSYASAFSHDSEVSEPGYYSVFLDRYKVKAELTSSERVALHRYTFPKSDRAGFILDFDYSLEDQKNEEMEIKVLSDTEIVGRKKTVYWAFDQYINFYAKFSKPFTYTKIEDNDQAKVLINFNTEENEEVLVKVGISVVDIDGAKNNVEKELPGWDFEGVRKQTRKAWNKYLSNIQIKTDNKEQEKTFYTALYHTAISPNLFTDVDGRHWGMDFKVHQGNANRPLYTIFSLWDTFRAVHPLMTIIEPTLNQAFIRSLIQKQKEGGILPMWELAGNYTGTMIGYHAVPVIVDSYMKGLRDFDVKEAFKACVRAAEYDTSNINCPDLVLPHLMPAAKYWKNKTGYVPCDKDNEAVAKALEFAYNDWCISIFADSLGEIEQAKKYASFAKAYQIYYDAETGFMRGVDSKGEWRTPFNPSASNHRKDDYCEGNAWQWTWFVPHDVDGLMRLMGGRKQFASKLDALFNADSSLAGDVVSADISGLIGQYAHGNEPSHHVTHLYNYAGEAWKTQELVDSVLTTLYHAAPDGLSGNEDCGQMSAWYVLNAMGFYQVSPGNPTYSIGRPLFDEVTIPLENGNTFTILVHNNSKENKYIQSMKLNGEELNKPFFTHKDILAGKTLEITMGNTPVKK